MSGAEAFPTIAPAEAIAFFRAKGWAIGFAWQDIWQEEHAKAFTVAKAMSRDLLEDIRAAVDGALAEGTTLQQFVKDLRPRLVARGWWGKKWMADPQTGEERVVQLGSPARLRTIYETNLRTSYMAGRWERVQRAKKTMPFLRYVSVMDGRERPEHHAWHGTVLPVDDPWWDTHFPPCGWNCRCDAQPVNQRMLDRRGWELGEPPAFPTRDYVNKRTGEVTRVEQGIDPGWSYNVGKAALDALTPAPRLGKGKNDKGGEDTALQAFSSGDFARVRGFFAAFGLGSLVRAKAGTVWIDPAGWQLAISLGLLRGADGSMIGLSLRDARALRDAAKVLMQPDRIGLVWIKGQDGRALLVRRYASALGVVDMGRDFWRWRIGASAAGMDMGLVIWAKDAAELAAYDPHQPRHPIGSRDGGRFRSTGRGAALASMTGAMEFFPTATLGRVSDDAAARAARSGVDIAGRGVRLEHSNAKHTLERHGLGRERRHDQRAITPHELLNAHTVINSAHSFVPERGARLPRFKAVARIGAEEHHVVAEVSKRNVSIVTMFVKK